jgi:uncharacterized protein YraI
MTAPTASAAPAFKIGDAVVVTANQLNVRAQPGLSGRIVNVLPQGWRAFIDSAPQAKDGFTWYRLWYMGESGGWVAGEYLARAADGGGFPLGVAVVVNTDRLNARAEPGLDGRIVNVLPRGWLAFIDSAPQSEDGFTWYRIRYMGETAWVAGEFLAFA